MSYRRITWVFIAGDRTTNTLRQLRNPLFLVDNQSISGLSKDHGSKQNQIQVCSHVIVFYQSLLICIQLFLRGGCPYHRLGLWMGGPGEIHSQSALL